MSQKPYETLVPSPCYVCEEEALEANLVLIDRVQQATGVSFLLALKSFAMFALAPNVRRYLKGTAASGYNEARLGREMYGGEVHTFCPAIKDEEFDALATLSDHLIFNSFSQWKRHRNKAKAYPELKCGIRINPEFSEVSTDIYNPCGPYSRLGVIKEQFDAEALEGISGLHFHALCEQDSYALEGVIGAFEARFGDYLEAMEWVNFGGGNLLTRQGYDIEHLIKVLNGFKGRYPHLTVYLEPGSAVAWETGVLIGEVVDIVHNGMDIAILDISATTHMPDVLEMPYRPRLLGADEPLKKAYTYRLGGPSCLAGDVIGDYSFDTPLCVGDRVVFDDMIHYTMVKTSTFNGVNLPAIAIWRKEGHLEVIKTYDYESFKERLS